MSGIQIKCNGAACDVNAGATILDLLIAKSIDPSHVVVEFNRSIVKTAELSGIILHQDDSLEILRFVGGG